MTAQQLQELKINALALRKIAEKVLEQVQAAEAAAPAKRRREKQEDRLAALKARILTNKRKPT